MAKIKGTFATNLKGRVGNVVYRNVQGENIASQRPASVNNPKSIPQMLQRAFFNSVQQEKAALLDIVNHSHSEATGKSKNLNDFSKTNIERLRKNWLSTDDFDYDDFLLKGQRGLLSYGAQVSSGSLPFYGYGAPDTFTPEKGHDVWGINIGDAEIDIDPIVVFNSLGFEEIEKFTPAYSGGAIHTLAPGKTCTIIGAYNTGTPGNSTGVVYEVLQFTINDEETDIYEEDGTYIGAVSAIDSYMINAYGSRLDEGVFQEMFEEVYPAGSWYDADGKKIEKMPAPLKVISGNYKNWALYTQMSSAPRYWYIENNKFADKYTAFYTAIVSQKTNDKWDYSTSYMHMVGLFSSKEQTGTGVDIYTWLDEYGYNPNYLLQNPATPEKIQQLIESLS